MSKGFEVRRARLGDAEVVADLWEALLEEHHRLDPRLAPAEDARVRWLNDFREWVTASEVRRLFVAEREGVVIGFASAHPYGPPPVYAPSSEVFLSELYVEPPHRGIGAGKALVEAVIAWADELEADRVRLIALSKNRAALDFWSACGAEPLSQVLTIERSP